MLRRGRTSLFVRFPKTSVRKVLPALFCAGYVKENFTCTMDDMFEGFPCPAKEVKKYFYNLPYFMIKTFDGKLIDFTPANADAFLEWLRKNNIPDIRDIEGY